VQLYAVCYHPFRCYYQRDFSLSKPVRKPTSRPLRHGLTPKNPSNQVQTSLTLTLAPSQGTFPTPSQLPPAHDALSLTLTLTLTSHLHEHELSYDSSLPIQFASPPLRNASDKSQPFPNHKPALAPAPAFALALALAPPRLQKAPDLAHTPRVGPTARRRRGDFWATLCSALLCAARLDQR